MNRLFIIIIFSMMILVYGCAYPTSSVRVPDERPSIVIQNAPKSAILFVDGLNMGLANRYNGRPGALLLEPGTHMLEVKNEGKVLLSEKVFLGGGEMKELKVHISGEAR